MNPFSPCKLRHLLHTTPKSRSARLPFSLQSQLHVVIRKAPCVHTQVVAQRSSISPVSRPSVVRQVRPSPSSAQPAKPAKAKSSGPLSGLFSQVEDPLLRIALQVSSTFHFSLSLMFHGFSQLHLSLNPSVSVCHVFLHCRLQ